MTPRRRFGGLTLRLSMGSVHWCVFESFWLFRAADTASSTCRCGASECRCSSAALSAFPRLGHELLIPLHVRLQLLHLQLPGLTLLGHCLDLRLRALVMVNDLMTQGGSKV